MNTVQNNTIWHRRPNNKKINKCHWLNQFQVHGTESQLRNCNINFFFRSLVPVPPVPESHLRPCFHPLPSLHTHKHTAVSSHPPSTLPRIPSAHSSFTACPSPMSVAVVKKKKRRRKSILNVPVQKISSDLFFEQQWATVLPQLAVSHDMNKQWCYLILATN